MKDASAKRDQAETTDMYPPLVQPEPLRHQVHGMLEQLIIDGRLQPGQRLIETELAERLGVSRGPVREGLQMLARERWVELRPRHGAYVAKPSLNEIVGYFDVRALLEVEAARLAASAVNDGPTPASQKLIDELNEIVMQSSGKWDGTRSEQAEIADATEQEAREFHRSGSQRFHHVLAEVGGNDALVDLLERLGKRTRWFFSPRVLQRTTDAWQEHQQLCSTVSAGDVEEAVRVMTHHMQATRASYIKAYEAG